ncbi:MAG: hypothetical protein M5U12_32190 [Verrucomicrobia bacterium]|nr:hypothetical protein [Verrucomicrobiota bacterium]
MTSTGKRRGPGCEGRPPTPSHPVPRFLPADESAPASTTDRVPDPIPAELDEHREAEWRANLLREALERVKRKVNPAHYEIYHLTVVQGLSARAAAQALAVSLAQVYPADAASGGW